ncbi:hypothetical protein ACX93W_22300 [Paenibacillus sp. CAU 1782]
MRISSSIAPGSAAASPERAKHGSALERQISFLQKQVQALKENKQSSLDSAEAIKELEKQISGLQQQLNLEKLQENKRKLEEAKQKTVEQTEREAAKQQEPDQAIISQQARHLFSAMSGKEELNTLQRTQSLLPTQEERDKFAGTITNKAFRIQGELVRNSEMQAELARTLIQDKSTNTFQDPVLLAAELGSIEMESMERVDSPAVMLEKALNNLPSEASEAVHSILNINFNPSNFSDFSREQLFDLRQTGMVQAKYIADNYITDENQKEQFMYSMYQFSFQASVKKAFAEVEELAIAARNGIPANLAMHEEQKLENDRIDAKNLFKGLNTSTLSHFVKDMMSRLDQPEPTVASQFNDNLQDFVRKFGLSSPSPSQPS